MANIEALQNSYDSRKNRGIFGLRLNLWLRWLYFEKVREEYLSRANQLLENTEWSVVDLGCNAWDKTDSLLRKFPNRKILWFDIHKTSVQEGHERFAENSRVEICLWNALELSEIIQGKVACVFTSQMMHHFDLEDRIICLDEMYKSLPKWWILVISDTFMDAKSNIGNLLKKGYMWLAKSDAYHNISPEQMKEEAEFIWFKIVERVDSLPAIEKRIGFYPTTIFIFQKPSE